MFIVEDFFLNIDEVSTFLARYFWPNFNMHSMLLTTVLTGHVLLFLTTSLLISERKGVLTDLF